MQALTFFFAFVAVLALIGARPGWFADLPATAWAPTPIVAGCRAWR